MSGISKVFKPRFNPIFTKHNIKHMVVFTFIAFLGLMLVSNYYDSKALQLENEKQENLQQKFRRSIKTGETIDLQQENAKEKDLSLWDKICQNLAYNKTVGFSIYLFFIFIIYGCLYWHYSAFGEKRGVRFDVKQEDVKVVQQKAVVVTKSLEEYEREGKDYTIQEVKKLQQTQAYRVMMKEKGRKPENWNWQMRQRKYGDDDPNLARQKKAGDELFESPSKSTTPQKKVYLLRSNTDSSKKKTRSQKLY